MTDRLQDRITDQFSYRSDHADIWRGLDLFLDTDTFLNLGYSTRYQSHLLGSPQRRLVAKIGTELTARRPELPGDRLLDSGCGRGGPAVLLAKRFRFDVTGIDLVPYNVATARAYAHRHGVPAEFLVGDAVRLPFDARSFAVCTALDAVVYMSEKSTVFEEMGRVTRKDGFVVVSDLVVGGDMDTVGTSIVDGFADAWDMPPLPTLERYRHYVEQAGLAVERIQDISPNSIDRFRKWSRLYLWLVESLEGFVELVFTQRGVDVETITEQVRRAHAALPYLRHVIVYARR